MLDVLPMNDSECTWPIWLRWLLFLPVGFVATALIQGVIRHPTFFSELLERGVEPWAFMLPALWVMPKGKRVLISLATCFFIGTAILSFYMAIYNEQYSEQPWAVISFSIVRLISTSFCAYICWTRD